MYQNGRYIWLFAACLFLSGHFILSAQTTYYSQQTGNWDEAATWGGGPPGPADHAVIREGHSVRIRLGGAGTFITNLTIDAGGVLDADNKEMNVNGTFIVNGTYTSFEGAAQDLNFGGDSLGGSGTISVNKGTSYFIFGENAVIVPSAQLKIFGHIVVDNGVTVTNKGSVSVSGDVNGSHASTSVWSNDAGSAVEVKSLFMATGILNASASGNIVKYAQQDDQSVTTPSANTYYNLTISGLGTKTISSDLTISNDLTISSGTFDCNDYNLVIMGKWMNDAGFTEGSGAVTFSGAGDQAISNSDGELFHDLVVNKSSGTLVLDDDITISNTLTLSSGIIEAGNNVITLGTGTGSTGTLNRTGGFIVGSFKRWVNSASTFLFPIGKQSYQPVSITLNGLVAGGSLMAEFLDSDPGLDGLPLHDDPDSVFNPFVDGYWSMISGDGLDIGVAGTYDILLDGTGFTAFTITDATRVLVRNDAGSDWMIEGNHQVPVGLAARRAGLSSLPAEFAFGDTSNCSRPVASAITGLDEVCTGSSGVTYEVTDHPPDIYTWIITGGTQSSGGYSNSITVDWGTTGMATANVRVIVSNACTAGAPVDLPVTIHSIQPASISGRKAVAELTTAEPYYIEGLSGYTYTWTITGGTQVSGGTSDSITVDWGAFGTGTVSVEASSGACVSAPATLLSVNKYVVIESIATGDWNDPNTWDCNCEPLPTENVRINNGHTVTIIAGGAGTEVNNFIIEAGGVLDPHDRIMTIHGDFDLNGTYLTGNKDLVMDGFGTAINGTGTLQRGIILSANIQFLSTAVINVTQGDIDIDPGIEISNYGSVTIADNINGGNASSKWTNKGNSTLRIGGELLTAGILSASATGNTVTYNGAGTVTVKAPVSSYYNLTIGGSGTNVLGTAVDINGDLKLTGTGTLDVTTGNYGISLAGDWINSGGIFNEQSGLVVFDGTADQTITGAETFYDLNYTNTQGLYLNNNVSISGMLTMAGGNIYPQANKLVIGTGAGAPGSLSYISGIVAGQTERWATSTATGYLFPIGTPTVYRPVKITYNNLGIGSLLFEFVSGDPGTAGLPLSEGTVNVTDTYSEGYWNATATNGITTNDFNIQLTATGFTSYPIIAGTRIIRDTIGGDWVLDGIHAAASDPDLYRNNLTGGISATGTKFAIGHVECGGLSIDRTITNVSCNGDSDGAIDITVNGGTAPYTFAWGHGPVTEDISGLSAGSYTVTVTDNDGCTIDSTWTVTEPSLLSAVYSKVNVDCKGAGNGSIDITPSGGTVPYTFSWSHGPTTEDVSGLSAGSYTVAITDVNSCILDTTINITEPAAMTAVINSTDVTCNGDSNGTITLSVPSGGSGTYEYAVSGTWQASTDFTGLNGGTYHVQMRDQAAPACVVILDSTYSIEEPLALVINRSITDINCYGDHDGGIDITPAGGTAPYTYSWSHGPVTEDVSGLAGGSYTVTVTDARTCTLDSTFTITEPASALVIDRVITHVLCKGASTGAVDITTTGGTAPYTYSWSHGPVTEDVNGLKADSYTVTVTDANGCSLDSTFTITEPALALVIDRVITHVSTVGGSDGAIDITPSGGTPGYTFNWSHGPVTEDVNGLSVGAYTILVTDANSCTLDSTFYVTEPGRMVIARTIKDISCYGEIDGAIDIYIVGGEPGYTYSWSHGPVTQDVTGLSQGSYTVTVTDTTGLTVDSTFTIKEPPILVINSVVRNVSCNAGTDGSIDITPGGGTPGYTFSWSHGPTSEDIASLAAGSYSVTVTDANGCTLDTSYTLTQPAPLVIDRTINDVSCGSGNDGSIDITVSGGTPGYVFNWSHGPVTEDVSSLNKGSYTITVTDAMACSLDSTFTVSGPEVAQPPVQANCSRDSICPGDGTVMLSYIEGKPGPGDTAKWYLDEGFMQFVGSGNNLIINTPDQPSTYYVRYEGDCGATEAVSVDLYIKSASFGPDSVLSSRDYICPGDDSIVLSYSGGILGEGAYAVWYADSLLSVSIGSGANLKIAAPETNTTYFVRFEGECNVTVPTRKSINTAVLSVGPDTAYISEDTICAGGSDQIVLFSEGGILGTEAVPTWYADPDFTETVGTGDGLSIIAPQVPKNYYVRYEGYCNVTDAVTASVFVEPKPVPAFVEKTEAVCAGSGPVWYKVEGGNGSSFSWNITGGTIEEDYSDSVLVSWESIQGDYQVSVLETTQAGCQSDLLGLSVAVSSPTVELGADIIICEGDEATITPAGDFTDHIWHDGSSAEDYVTHDDEIVSILVEDDAGCQAVDSVRVTVVPLPIVNLGADTVLCDEASLILSGGDEGISYHWSTGENTQQITVFAGRQVIWVSMTSEYGCIGSDTIEIMDCSTEVLFENIPNVFTPNGDNYNDTWYFNEAAGFPEMVVEIYDRWGKLVWRSERGYPEPWDGRSLNGNEMPVDSYYYVIELNNGDDQIIGTVTIVK